MPRNWPMLYLMSDPPDYEQPASQSVAALAEARGIAPEVLALDHLLTNDGRGMLYLPFLNYADGTLDPSYEMLSHRDTVPGLSDGGAHVGMICDGSFPTCNLTHWTRDRTRGAKLPLATMVRMQTLDTARAVQPVRSRPARARLPRRPERDRLRPALALGARGRARPARRAGGA